MQYYHEHIITFIYYLLNLIYLPTTQQQKNYLVGAGDGRLLIRAVQRGAAYVEGWELNKEVYDLAVDHLNAVLSPDDLSKVKLIYGNGCSETPFKGFTTGIIVLYLLPAGLKSLSSHLLEAERGCGKRIISQGWPIPGLEIVKKVVTSGGSTLYLHYLE